MAVRVGMGSLTGTRAISLNWPLIAILTATLLRLALFVIPSHGYDSFAYKHWTWRLVYEPLTQFYIDDGPAFPDHLPGDLWLLKFLGSAARFADPGVDFYGPVYGAMIALMATGFDAFLALSLLVIGRQVIGERSSLIAATAYWCAPAPIFVASVWGQTDGISAALAVVALCLALSGRFSTAFLVLTLCVLVKPQFAMLALPLLVGWRRHDRHSRFPWLRRVFATGLMCVALLAMASAPFGVSLVGEWGAWSLLERIQFASDRYPISTLGAHNIWILSDPLNAAPEDTLPWVFGLSRHLVGLLLFVGVVLYVYWLLALRWRGLITMVVASNVLMLGFFLVATRMHERYLFPVAGLSILLALLDHRYMRYAIAINLLVFANIAMRFAWPQNDEWGGALYFVGLRWLEHGVVVRFLAFATIVVFGWVVIEGGRRTRP